MYDAAVGGNDRISGGANGDLLIGDGVNVGEAIFGGARPSGCGNDRLDGGPGNDTLSAIARWLVGLTVCGDDVLTAAPATTSYYGDADPT